MSLEIDDGFLPHFKAILESFVKDKKVKVLEEDSVEYDYASACPSELIVSSVEEVRRRVYAAEERIKENGGLSEAEYELQMDKFFKEELGIDR